MGLTHTEKLIAKACLDWDLLQEGDRILIGASGGKDSTLLAWALSRRLRWQRPRFELSALRIRSDVPGSGLTEKSEMQMNRLYAEWGIPLHVLDAEVVAALKPGKTMSCYWCSTRRRTELINYALEHGYNKIALGHHLDDALATLFMNMTKKGELASMTAKMSYQKYPLQIIRPLILLSEDSIRDVAAEAGWLAGTCSCDYGADGERKEYQRRVNALCANSLHAKRKILESLYTIKTEYLPKEPLA